MTAYQMDDSIVGPIGGVLAGLLIAAGIGVNTNSLFPNAMEELLPIEGGYVNHRHDRGGATIWGVTEATARECGYTGPMNELTIEVAAECAYRHFWKPLGGDVIATKNDTVYAEFMTQLFFHGYHAGTVSAGRWFQECLNVFNRGERDYTDIRVDGRIGQQTLIAFNAFRARRGTPGAGVLSTCLEAKYTQRLLTLIERDPSQESFAYGWFSKRLD